MAEAKIGLPTDGPGKALDAESFVHTVLGLLHRERMQIAGALEAEIARVLNTDPASGDYALVVREAGLKDPKISTATVATVSAGGTGSVDSTQLSSGVTGKLLAFEASGSAPFKVELQTALNAVATTVYTAYGPNGQASFASPHRDLVTQVHSATVGFDGFRLIFTNLNTGITSTDFHGTFLWDEV